MLSKQLDSKQHKVVCVIYTQETRAFGEQLSNMEGVSRFDRLMPQSYAVNYVCYWHFHQMKMLRKIKVVEKQL